jgi:hypothetical protein
MSEAYHKSVRLYWMAKKTDAPNREFNVESQSLSVHDDYLACLRILALYSRTHQDTVVAYAIWGGRKKLGLKFQGKNVIIGSVIGGDIPIGVTREVKNPYELKKFLENTMGFTVENLNEGIFEKASEQLKRIESEKKITIDREGTKEWQIPRA